MSDAKKASEQFHIEKVDLFLSHVSHVVTSRLTCVAGDAGGQDARDRLGSDARQHQRAGGSRVLPPMAARPREASQPRLSAFERINHILLTNAHFRFDVC